MAKKAKMKSIQGGIKNPIARTKAAEKKNQEALDQNLVMETAMYQKAKMDYDRGMKIQLLQLDGKIFDTRKNIMERLILTGNYPVETEEEVDKLLAITEQIVTGIMSTDNAALRDVDKYAIVPPKPEKPAIIIEAENKSKEATEASMTVTNEEGEVLQETEKTEE